MGPSVTRSGPLTLVPDLRNLLLLLGCLQQFQCGGFCFIFIIFYFVIFGCYLLEAWSLPVRDIGSHLGGRAGGGGELGGAEEGGATIGIDSWENNAFSRKGKINFNVKKRKVDYQLERETDMGGSREKSWEELDAVTGGGGWRTSHILNVLVNRKNGEAAIFSGCVSWGQLGAHVLESRVWLREWETRFAYKLAQDLQRSLKTIL